MAAWQDDWEQGDRLGDYVLTGKLGEGGIARVYEGRHALLDTRVAIKTLRPERRASADLRARFDREARAMARLHHAHAAKVITVGEHKGAPYLVMEFLAGGTLEAHLKARAKLPAEDTLALLLPVCSAVDAAHAAGLVHRDLKPSNVMLEPGVAGRPRPVVVDFGIARLDEDVAGHHTGSSAVLGTPAYMAPEQVRSTRDADAAADQYALGVILYECLAGERAFAGATVYEVIANVSVGKHTPLRKHRGDLPDALAAAVERAMRLDPRKRFPSVRAFARELLPFADPLTRATWDPAFGEGAPPIAAPPSPAPTAPAVGNVTTLAEATRAAASAGPDRRATWVAASVALLVVAALTVGVMTRERPPARYRVALAVTPGEARVTLDDRAVGTGRYVGDFAADGTRHTLRLDAEGYVGEDVTFVNAPPPGAFTLRRRAARPEPQARPEPDASAPVDAAVAVAVAVAEPDASTHRRRRADGERRRDEEANAAEPTPTRAPPPPPPPRPTPGAGTVGDHGADLGI